MRVCIYWFCGIVNKQGSFYFLFEQNEKLMMKQTLRDLVNTVEFHLKNKKREHFMQIFLSFSYLFSNRISF